MALTTRMPGKRILAAAAIASAAVAVPAAALAASSAAAVASAAAAPTPQCQTRSMVTWLDTRSDGAAGNVAFPVDFTNLSGHACRMYGFPGVSAVSLLGAQLGRPAARDASRVPEKTVTLRPGQTASFVLVLRETVYLPGRACRPVTAAGLRVYPPGQTASKVVPFPFGACSARGVTFLTVSSVTSYIPGFSG